MNYPPLPNIPWEKRPNDCNDVVWRYSANPIIPRDLIPSSNSIFNSAVVPFEDKFAGVFRCDNKKREMNLHRGFSGNGIDWRLDDAPIDWQFSNTEHRKFEHRYDPRVVWLEDRYYISWCNGYHGPTIGLGYTTDFTEFHFIENALLPFNRNGVLFPRRINDVYVMLNRPSDNGHTPFGDIFLSQSPDLVHWGRHRFVMGVKEGWQSTKIGAGPVPIETDEGWLLFYHGVLTSCNGFRLQLWRCAAGFGTSPGRSSTVVSHTCCHHSEIMNAWVMYPTSHFPAQHYLTHPAAASPYITAAPIQ